MKRNDIISSNSLLLPPSDIPKAEYADKADASRVPQVLENADASLKNALRLDRVAIAVSMFSIVLSYFVSEEVGITALIVSACVAFAAVCKATSMLFRKDINHD